MSSSYSDSSTSPSRGRSLSKGSTHGTRSTSSLQPRQEGKRVPDTLPEPSLSKTPSSDNSFSPTTVSSDISSPFSMSRPNSALAESSLVSCNSLDSKTDASKTLARTSRMPVPVTTMVPAYEQDSRFWFHDGNLLLQINSDSKTFKLHRSILEMHSSVFKDRLKIQIAPDELVSVAAPFGTAEDFRELLALIYPLDFLSREEINAEQWGSILRAATHLQFSSVRELAIQQLTEKAGPVDKIALGHGLDVPKWLEEAYKAVCDRQEPLTEEEGKKLGVEVVVRVMRARESMRSSTGTSISTQTLQEVFGLSDPVIPSLPPVMQSKPSRSPDPTVRVLGPASQVTEWKFSFGCKPPETSSCKTEPDSTASGRVEGIFKTVEFNPPRITRVNHVPFGPSVGIATGRSNKKR